MSRKKINSEKIISDVANLILNVNYKLPNDIINHIKSRNNIQPQEKELIENILINNKIANKEKIALCQDTGISIFFIEIGTNVEIVGKDLNIEKIINKAIKKAYSNKSLRPSIIDDPLCGKNTKDNTPAIIHLNIIEGNNIKIQYMAKGGGSENLTTAIMLPPSSGFEGIKDLIIKTIKEKGKGACPPLIVGIGIGGTLDKAITLSKKALFRKIGSRNKKKYYKEKELELFEELNKLNIGVMGLGGNFSVMDVFIEEYPRHMATLAVAISAICHSARKGKIIL
jgi:fumarate hydratase subunit alpha